MKVYTLITTVPYEGDELWGVYSSREAAEAAFAADETFVSGSAFASDEILIEEFELDAPALPSWKRDR